MSDTQRTGDQGEKDQEGVELQLPSVDEALEAGTSATIVMPSQYELAVIVRDATVTFLALPPDQQTEAKLLELTVASAAEHGYPNVEAGLDHMPTQGDVEALNDYIAEVDQLRAESAPDADTAE